MALLLVKNSADTSAGTIRLKEHKQEIEESFGEPLGT
jgi:hypothetical protein